MAAHHASLDPRTPVIVGVGQVDQRTDVLADALEPVALLAEAARAAGADSGSDRLLAELDTIATVNTLSWNYGDPAALVAQQIGSSPARTWATHDGGNYPQYLLNRVAGEIQAGTADAVLIGGVECMRTASAAHGQGADLGWTVQAEGTSPTHTFTNPEELWHRVEWKRHIIMPVSFYALYENALRAESGRTPAEHLAHLAALWARFSAVAAGNPHAWLQDPVTADEIGTVSPGNRMIELPYTKFLNANMMVDQAACFIVCSAEKARALGIPTDRWVFPWVGTEAHEHWFVSTRMSLTDTPAVRVAGRAALELAGVGVDDIAHLDLYSCFPSAVQIAARELAIDLDRQLTVTGGLAFAGGPMNNYVSHSIAAMTDRLRADAGSLGLVWANGGFLTKHAFGIYGTEPPADGFRHRDLQAEIDALPQREVVDEAVAQATIETSTVSYHRDGRPNRGVAFALLPDGRRAIGLTLDPEVMDELATVETAGRAASVDADGTLRLA